MSHHCLKYMWPYLRKIIFNLVKLYSWHCKFFRGLTFFWTQCSVYRNWWWLKACSCRCDWTKLNCTQLNFCQHLRWCNCNELNWTDLVLSSHRLLELSHIILSLPSEPAKWTITQKYCHFIGFRVMVSNRVRGGLVLHFCCTKTAFGLHETAQNCDLSQQPKWPNRMVLARKILLISLARCGKA